MPEEQLRGPATDTPFVPAGMEDRIISAGDEAGVSWVVARGPQSFAYLANGYALLPAGHPWRDLVLQGDDYEVVDVHGGITWGPTAEGWIGFDFNHAGDYWPGQRFGHWRDDVERTVDDVVAEARALARQIAAAMP